VSVAREQALAVPQLQIHVMQEAHILEVIRIERACYPFPWTEGIFRDCLRVHYVCRVVELGVAVIGYGIMSLGAGEAHLLNVCIDEPYRCRGIGRHLLDHLLQLAAHAGTQEAFLEARPSNTAAIRLYETLGFAQIGIRRGYYQAVEGREDAIVLKCRLNQG